MGTVRYPSRKEAKEWVEERVVGHCGKEAMRGGRSEPSKWIPGGGQFRGPLISGPVRAEQLT